MVTEGAAATRDAFPFVQLTEKLLFGSRRKVFAHWHWFPISFDNQPASHDYYATQLLSPAGLGGQYRNVGGFMRNRPLPRPTRGGNWRLLDMIDDLAYASAIGVDAFQVNLRDLSPKSFFIQDIHLLLDAAVASQSPTRVYPNLDCSSELLDLSADKIVAALGPVFDHPAVYRGTDGKVWLGAFYAEAWDVARWSALLAALRAKYDVHFFPVFLNAGRASIDHLKLANTVGTWTADREGAIAKLGDFAARARSVGASWCQPVSPQDFRPKNAWYTEAKNSAVFREGWEAAIANGADAVNITTWNDYSEGSAIRPSTGIQYGYYDLAAYYISWFKTASRPQIVRDVLYYFHRIEIPRGPEMGTMQSRRLMLSGSPLPSNLIEVVACLTAPGDVSIGVGDSNRTEELQRGLSAMTMPMSRGVPRFALERHGTRRLSFESAFPIPHAAPFEDFLYRAGSSNRLPVSG